MLNQLKAVWPPLLLMTLSSVTATTLALSGHPLWALPATAFTMLMGADVGARLKDYRLCVAAVEEFTTSDNRGIILARLLHQHKHSWCQREMMKAVADEVFAGQVGGPRGRELVGILYRSLGYRWFHIFPDNAFRANSPLLRRSWWRGFFGL